MTVGDRVKLRELACEWGAEIGIEPEKLARAIVECALDGDFECLPEFHGLTVYDEKRLCHIAVQRKRTKASRSEIELYTRLTMLVWGWAHRDCVAKFATSAGRDLPLPTRWSRKTQANGSQLYSDMLDEIRMNPGVVKEVARDIVKRRVGSRYVKDIFEAAWLQRLPGEVKSRGGRPRKNLS